MVLPNALELSGRNVVVEAARAEGVLSNCATGGGDFTLGASIQEGLELSDEAIERAVDPGES